MKPSRALFTALLLGCIVPIESGAADLPKTQISPRQKIVVDSKTTQLQKAKQKPVFRNTGPTLNTVTINNGAQYTSARTVILDHIAHGNPTFYRAGENSNLNNLQWLPYVPSPTYTLSAGNGNKTVYMQVRTGSSNETGSSLQQSMSNVVSDSITLMNPRVLSLSLNNGQSNTNSYTITLNNNVEGSATQYRASQNQNFAGTNWQAYSTAPSFELSGNQGQKRIYFQVRNGNDMSNVISDTIDIHFSTEYTVPAKAAYDYARTHGFDFVAKGDPPSDLASCTFGTFGDELRMYTQNKVSVPGAGIGPLGASCLFELFTGDTLNTAWRVRSVDVYAGFNFTWRKRVTANSNDASFKVKVDKPAGELISRDLRFSEIILVGPDNANWEDAFN